jgi:hypothetical protein
LLVSGPTRASEDFIFEQDYTGGGFEGGLKGGNSARRTGMGEYGGNICLDGGTSASVSPRTSNDRGNEARSRSEVRLVELP